MKIQLLFLSALLFGIVACAAETQFRLPELKGVKDGQEIAACAAVFPDGGYRGHGGKGRWQFVHSIDFTMKDGSGTTVIGVTSLSGKDIECALMTVEGLTLFEAVFGHDQRVEVRRAVPPFDRPGFATGLINDIRAIFQPPPGSMETGQLQSQLQPQSPGITAVCRYRDGSNGVVGVVDVLPDVDGCWQIKSYTSDLVMNRSITGLSCRKRGPSRIPDHILLKTYGQTGYTLKMTLISADNIK
jgi:hypothetical protein